MLAAVLLLSACGWNTYDRREKYLEAEVLEPVTIPESLDRPPFEAALEVPPVEDPRNIAGQKMEVGLPEALSTTFGVDYIVIRKLGDSRWVFVDTAPAIVWPKIRQFWQDSNMPLATADPSRGVMESEWLISAGGTPAEVFESIKSGMAWADEDARMRHKFRLTVEPGIRAGSTEIYLEHKSLPLGSPVREDSVEWTGVSDDLELEGEMLTGLAYYLGERINQSPAVSLLANNIGGQRAELVPDRQKPVLKYKLRFDRAWATVGNALENAKIDVEDLDRNAANYYVYYDDSAVEKPGFFGRLFSDDEGERTAPGDENRYLVHLDSKDDEEVHVIVMKDKSTLADALVAERLLKIIKEYST